MKALFPTCILLALLITPVISRHLARNTEQTPTLERPRIVIYKAARKLELFDNDRLVNTYKMALGFNPVGDKEVEGDGKTPEGEFYIFTKNPNSRFHLSLAISYPSKEDAERGLKQKLITRGEYSRIVRAIDARSAPPQKTRLGGEIYIHGGGAESDWTLGCVALSNRDIEELFALMPRGAPVLILP